MSTTNALVQYSIPDMTTMASAIAKSGLFGIKTPEQALTLMMIAQAEGYHPALAARDYHIIQGKPALKADAMLTRFHQAGGKVEWHEYTDKKVSATFSHSQGGTIKVEWDIDMAKKAGVYDSNPVWKKYPRSMLRARVISEAIRAIFPGVGAVGIYTPEEMDDIHREQQQENMSSRNKKISNNNNSSEFSPIEFVQQIDSCTTIDQLKATLEANWPHISRHPDKNHLVDHYNAAKKNLLEMLTIDTIEINNIKVLEEDKKIEEIV